MSAYTVFKLHENIRIEDNIQHPEYDGVILILFPEAVKVAKPKSIASFVEKIANIDKHIEKTPTVWNSENVSGGRLIISPTGIITPYHDVKVLKDAAKKGVARALEAGCKAPLLVVQNVKEYPDGELVTILGALEAFYTPIQIRERDPTKYPVKLGLHPYENNGAAFKKIVSNAIALEKARIVTRDIAGADPERMAPGKVVEYVKEVFADDANVTIHVIDDQEVIKKEFPLLAAVSRAANQIERHQARLLKLEYKPADLKRVTETLMLVGKGVTYDTGGADIKINGNMTSMSRDKSGAAAVAGFLKACALLKPAHLKVIGILCLCRNSVGEDSYVTDELLVSRSGKTVRVTNTDAEGRLAMADSVCKVAEVAAEEINPHIYTIATLTGHAKSCYGKYLAAMDNYSAKATNHSGRLQLSGSLIGEGIDVSTIRAEDLAVNDGKMKGDDLVQYDTECKSRNHQLAAGFLIRAGGLEDKDIKYTHLDIAGAAGMSEMPTAVPVLSLCHFHKVLLE